jgi:pyruvate,orthophosphate dikinase
MAIGDLHIDIVRPRAHDPRDVGVIIESRAGAELGGKARVFASLAARGFRIPATICVKVPARIDCDEASDHMQSTLLGGLLKTALGLLGGKCHRRDGNEPDPLLIAIRANRHAPGQWLPARLNISAATAGAQEELQKRTVDELVRWVSALIGCGPAGSNDATQRRTTEVLMQEMCPAMVAEGDTIGWVWTRNPITGGDEPIGYVRAMGERRRVDYLTYTEWSVREPAAAAELAMWVQRLDPVVGGAYRICFGVAQGVVHLLALHAADLAPQARWQVAAECIERGLMTTEEKLLVISPEDLRTGIPLPVEERGRLPAIASTNPGGTLTVCGRAAFSRSQVERLASKGESVVWVKESLVPDDVSILDKVVGVVTRIGGPASHVVVLARGRGIAALPGLRDIALDTGSGGMAIGSCQVREGEWLTIEESTGTLYVGKIESDCASLPWTTEVLQLALKRSGARVLVNADSADDVRRGFRLGASAVGLCRSENHLLDPDALAALRRWVVEHPDLASVALPEPVLEALRRGLTELLLAADGRRVHYRLFDAHLEEFLPSPGTEAAMELACNLHMSRDLVDRRLRELREVGAAHGYRGCRWGLRTGFYRQQLRLVARVVESMAQDGRPARIAVIVPMVSVTGEVETARRIFQAETGDVAAPSGDSELRFGCMVETPRACLVVTDLANNADVLCFGTNDLTEAVWALSRDLGRQVATQWLAEGIVDGDPFVALDQEGVGSLIAKTVAAARLARPDVEIIACGEQGGDPRSAAWLVQNGVDRVSCRADAVPAVMLAISQAEFKPQRSRSESCRHAWRSGVADASQRAYDRIRHARTCRADELARQLAREWGTSVSALLSLPKVGNWKFFKRDLVQYWFGRREYRRFPSGWHTEEVLKYALQYRGSGRTVRYSLFPDAIACHAVSKVLRDGSPIESWENEIEALDHCVPLEVFPQQPPTNVCFRAVFWGSHMDVEAGVGQAMYVFEEERGQHPVLRAVMDHSGAWRLLGDTGAVVDRRLKLGLRHLMERYGMWIYLRLWDMSTVLGAAWLGVEGYYDPRTHDEPFLCDMDLPQDLAFLSAE